MKCVTKSVIFLLFLWVFAKDALVAKSIVGHIDSINSYESKMPPPLSKVEYYQPILWYNLESGSNGVPFSMLSRFAFGGYISPSEMNDYQSLLSTTGNRMGAIQSYGMTIYPIPGIEVQKKGSLETITLEIDDYSGANFTQDAFRMIFQGNTNYLGQTLNADNNKIESLRTRSLKFNFRKSYRNIELIPTIQFGQCLNFTSIETQNIKLQSDALGDELQFSGNAYSANSGYSFWGTGYGVQAGLSVDFKNIRQTTSKVYSLSFGVKNFGFYTISNVNTVSRNAVWNGDNTGLSPEGWVETSAFNLKAAQISSSDLQFGSWFDRQGDSIKSKLNFIETERKGTILAPFIAHAKLTIRPHTYVSGITRHEISLKYVYLTGYMPQVSYWAFARANFKTMKGNTKFSFNYMVGLSVGGFDDFDLNAGIMLNSFKFRGKTVMTILKFTGLESFVVPSKFHGAGAFVQLSYPLHYAYQ